MRFALVIVIPDDEEASVGTLKRALAAKEQVQSSTPVSEMTVVCVRRQRASDVRSAMDQPEFDSVRQVKVAGSMGYGAMVKAGWQATKADLLGFIDGDGSFDPGSCVDLLNQMFTTQADVVTASRYGLQDHAPIQRRLAHFFAARFLGLGRQKLLNDMTCGFQILRRSSLKKMNPLPDGSNFPSAICCTCSWDQRLRIEEVPVACQLPVNPHRLDIWVENAQLFFTMLYSACCYSPVRMMTGLSVVWAVSCLAGIGATVMVGGPFSTIVILMLTTILLIVMTLGAGVVAHQINAALLGRVGPHGVLDRLLEDQSITWRLVGGGTFVAVVGVLALGIFALLNVLTDHEAIIAALVPIVLVLVGAFAAMGGVVLRMIWAIEQRVDSLAHPARVIDPTSDSGPGQLRAMQDSRGSLGSKTSHIEEDSGDSVAPSESALSPTP